MRAAWLLRSTPLLILMTAACTTLPSPQAPVLVSAQPQVRRDVPPPVVVTGDDQMTNMVHDPVQIEPERSVGYEELPSTVTQLFSEATLDLSLPELVHFAVSNDRGIAIAGYTLRIAEYNVPVARGIYDLVLMATPMFSRSEEQQSPVGFIGQELSSQRYRNGLVGLMQLLPTGGILQFTYNVVRNTNLYTDFDDNFNRTLATDTRFNQRSMLSLTQPLLRGFGPAVTNAGIRIAKLEHQGAAADYQTNLETLLTETITLYWQLVGAIELYKVQVIAYSAAEGLLRDSIARQEAGVIAMPEVLQARAAAEGRREEVIRARQLVRDIEDDLKSRIFLQAGTPAWNLEINPTQPIGWREIDVNQDDAIATALVHRSELRRARANIAQSDVNLDVTGSARLPQLNFVGSVVSHGLDTNFDRSWDTMADSKYLSYDIGLEFNYPLQNRTARYQHLQAQAQKQQAEEMLRQMSEQVTLQVRQAVRALRTARERIEATRSAVLSEEEKLRAEMRRLDVGISTAFQVLDFQEDLANAQAQHIQAVIDYNIAALNLERARGTLLEAYGIELVDAEFEPQYEAEIFPVGLK